MHLKQVHMENFKSFGRKLTVPFGPGYTGITGPNGSGKSNIGDAILFVLGPNSPRAIRAGRLTDLIFNGGEAGHAAKYTIVSLVFDNAAREMPVDADDVVLTRKVKRAPNKADADGYNSYFYVNGRAAKKREFIDLLNHAGISADGYNITKQGDVLALCEMTDAKRREVIDNISGVSTFDKDIDEANKRRAEVEENLDRIKIVLEEIDRNLRQLDKDKDAATKYRDLQAEIGRAKGLKAWRRKQDAEAAIAEVQTHLTEFDQNRAEHEKALTELRAEMKELTTQFAEVEQKIRAQGGEDVQKIQDELRAARDRQVRLEEKIQFCRDELAGGDEDVLPVKEELRRVEKELKNTDKLLGEAESAHAEATAGLAQRRKELDAVRDAISRSDVGAMAINRELGILKKEHEDVRIALHDARLKFDRFTAKREGLQRAQAEADAAHESAQTDLQEVVWELEQLQGESGGSVKKRKELERRAFELQKAEAELVQQSQDLDNRIRALDRELRDLQAQEAAAARHSGTAPHAVEALLDARRKGAKGGIKGIIGTIAELASVDDRYQTALETAAGANIHAVVVEDDGVAAECIELLKRTKAGRAKLLPLNKMVPGRPRSQALMKVKKDGCLGFALDLIRFDKRYHDAFWYVLGDTLVVATMDTGRRLMGGVRMVTLEGELFEAGGAMVGGAAGQGGKDGKAAFSKGDRGRIDVLLGQIGDAESALEKALERVAGLRGERIKVQEELESMGRAGLGTADRLKSLEKRRDELGRAVAAAHDALDSAEAELTRAVQAADAAGGDAAKAEKRLEALEAQREDKARLLLKGSKKEWREEVERLDGLVRSLHEAAVQSESRRDVAVKQRELIVARRTELEAKVEGAGSAHDKYREQLVGHQKALEKARAEVKALLEMENKATKQLGGLRDAKDKLYEKITKQEARIEKTADRIDTAQALVINAKAKLPALEEQLGEAKVELTEHPVMLGPKDDVPPFEELRKSLRDLEARLERLGAVNMRALEEYEAQAARKKDLVDEVERLRAQRQELIQLVDAISARKKTAFMEVFDAIAQNFTEVYEELSKGGKAYMELETPQDPFAGGLILKAQPEGKRVTRLQALSGGEKSLTSMAFIFAIQRYDPSPFYYFDEVDMNLDAVNSELLAKMIRKNARYAQFIQVSLRKITLKEAHNLYGVTQATPGQSEVIANFKLEDVREETDGPDADGAAKMAKARRDGVARRRARKVVAATVGVGDEVVMEADEPAGDDGGAYDGDDDGGDDGNGGADDDGNGGGVEDSGAFGEGSGSGSGDGTGHAHGGTARGDASGGSGSLSSAISGMIKVKAER